MYRLTDVMDFLAHAGERGLMPVATAQALAVAVRRVLDEILEDTEKHDIRHVDLDAAIRRFNDTRGNDFKPDSLREYQRRVKRAVDLFLAWRDNPAAFRPATRAPREGDSRRATEAAATLRQAPEGLSAGAGSASGGPGAGTSSHYSVVFPVRPGQLIGLTGIPYDLTAAESERLTQFVRSLVVPNAE